MKVRGWGATLAAGAVACVLGACIQPPAVAPVGAAISYPVSESTLPSGLRAVFEAEPDLGTGGVAMVVEAGSADEPAEKAGLAHLVEHLVFHGKHGDATFRSRMLALGFGSYNATTEWDETTYFAFGPQQNLQSLVSLYLDMLADPLAAVDEETFEHERHIVLDELHSRAEDGTPGEGFGLLQAAVFPAGHPYAHAVVGTEETLGRLTLADAQDFVKSHYRPAKAILALASPSSIEASKRLVTAVEATHSWTPGAPEPRRRLPSGGDAPANRAIAEHEQPVSTPKLWIGWPIPPRASAADTASVLAVMAHDTFSNDVYNHDPDVAYVDAYVAPGLGASLLYLEVTLREGTDPRSTTDVVIRTLQHGLGQRTYGGQLFGIYKQSVATTVLGRSDSIVSRTVDAAKSVDVTGVPTFLRTSAERIANLGEGATADFSHRYITAERASAVLIRPLPRGASSSRSRGAAAPQGGSKRDDFFDGGDPRADPAEAQSWMRAPGIRDARKKTLANGMTAVVLPRPGAPFHSLVLAYHGGAGDERTPGVGVASLWAKQRLRMNAETWGVEYRDRVEQDSTFEQMRAAGTDIDLTLKQLGAENEFRVFWPPDRFRNLISTFEKKENFPDRLLQRRLDSALFGRHPYGHQATTGEIRAVAPKDVYPFLDTIRQPSNGVVVLVGDVDGDAAMALLERQLGGGSRQTATPIVAPPPLESAAASQADRVVVQDRPGSDTARIDFRCALPPADSAGWGKAKILARAVGDGLYGNLRARFGVSYGVSADVTFLRGGTAILRASADVDPNHIDAALGAIHHWTDTPAASLVDEAAVALARTELARGFNLGFGTSQALAFGVVGLWNLGWPLETLDQLPKQIIEAQPADVAPLLAHCQKNWVLGLLGDERRIRDALSSAGL